MKHFLLVAMLSLPMLSHAQNYTYNRILVTEQGSDYISMDRAKVKQIAGDIAFNARSIKIDHDRYYLKPTRRENLYKSKHCFVKLVYTGNVLSCVQLYKYNQVLNYEVDRPVTASL